MAPNHTQQRLFALSALGPVVAIFAWVLWPSDLPSKRPAVNQPLDTIATQARAVTLNPTCPTNTTCTERNNNATRVSRDAAEYPRITLRVAMEGLPIENAEVNGVYFDPEAEGDDELLPEFIVNGTVGLADGLPAGGALIENSVDHYSNRFSSHPQTLARAIIELSLSLNKRGQTTATLRLELELARNYSPDPAVGINCRAHSIPLGDRSSTTVFARQITESARPLKVTTAAISLGNDAVTSNLTDAPEARKVNPRASGIHPPTLASILNKDVT